MDKKSASNYHALLIPKHQAAPLRSPITQITRNYHGIVTRLIQKETLICVPKGIANSCPAEPGQAARVVPLMLQQLQGTRVLNMTHYSFHRERMANSCSAEPGQAARVVPLMLQQLQGTRVLNRTHYSFHRERMANSCSAEPGQAARVVPLMLQQLQSTRVLNMKQFSQIENCEQLSC
jgi:hypothetical protein